MSDYTEIQPELDDFENAVYGEEVRDSMVSAIKKIYDIAESAAGASGQPTAVNTASEMEDTEKLYLYLGNESGYQYGYVYAYTNGAWTSTGLYGRGQDGTSGADGYSPTAVVTQTATGVNISITDKDGTTTATVENGTATQEQVDSWLDEHPEATTTVQDGSITSAKLASDVSDLVSDIQPIENVIGTDSMNVAKELNAITWVNGFFWPSTGEVRSDSSYKYTEEYINVSVLSSMKRVYLNTRSIACVVFYDESKNIVGYINATNNGSNIVTDIPIPADAVYFRISQANANIDPFPLYLHTVGDLLQTLETDLPVDIETVLTYQGGIKKDGTLNTYNDWKVTDFIKVASGEYIKFSGCGNIGSSATLYPIAFYDSDKNLIRVISPSETNHVSLYNKGWLDDSATGVSLNYGHIFVPQGAEYCRLSGYRELRPTIEPFELNQWAGKKCAFFGDSITAGISTAENYANFLAMSEGIIVANYAVNGSSLVANGMDRVTTFLTDYADKPADAFIFAYGTNDWSGGKPLGEWYTTDGSGVRTLTTDTTTFRGAWANILTYLKTNFDGKKIVLMTPIHRGAGSYPSDLTRNSQGLYLEDYVNVIKEAGKIFSVDVIDLYGESELVPDINPNSSYFTGNDRLHPNVSGHRQMAKVISAKMKIIEV